MYSCFQTLWTREGEEGITESKPTSTTPEELVLKPAWKRWGTAGGAIALASAVAGLLLVVRGRVIRRIVLLPNATSTPASGNARASGPARVLIQTASDRGAEKGRIVLPSSCEWGRGRGLSFFLSHSATTRQIDISSFALNQMKQSSSLQYQRKRAVLD